MKLPPSPSSSDGSAFVEPDAYAVRDYAGMIADKVRTNAYVKALRQTVRRGSFVLEIGTGAGIFAILAARMGARRVVAVEPDDAIELARELATVNDCADRIEFVQGSSMDLDPTEPADVIVSDLRGALPLYRNHIPSLVDARTRLLAPGGWLIPWRDTLWASPVEARRGYGTYVDVWRTAARSLEAESARALVANSWWRERLGRRALLAEPERWAILDYHAIEDPNVAGSMEWTVARAGTAHGLGMWFDAELAPGVSYSGAPGKPGLIYRHAFFPFSEPLTLDAGDRVAVTLQASLVGGDYVWRWQTTMWKEGEIAATFDQSTVHGTLLSPARLHRTMATHAPDLNDRGKVMHFTLGLMSKGNSLGEIADSLLETFPKRFRSKDEAFAYVARLSYRYST